MSNKPIFVVLGTRAQFIKVSPVLRELKRREIQYTLIYTNQHRDTVHALITELGIDPPDVSIGEFAGEKKTVVRMFGWWFRMLSILVLQRRKIISQKGGIILTHGDTVTTVWGALLGKLTGSKVMHIESGLRSFNLFRPFPEEINRLITFKLTDVYICPNEQALVNIAKYSGIKINVKHNTSAEALKYALCQGGRLGLKHDRPYFVAAIHRYENIHNQEVLSEVVRIVFEATQHAEVVFIQYPVTKSQLIKYGLGDALKENTKIHLIDRLLSTDFIELCSSAEGVLTDGGSIQEEMALLGVPTLLMRKETEWIDGLNENAVLSEFDKNKVTTFFNNYQKYRREPMSIVDAPSKIIADWLSQNRFG